MKWFDVVYYHPPKETGVCMVRNAWGDLYLAKPQFNVEGEFKWICIHQADKQYCNITHFCIPDPVELVP